MSSFFGRLKPGAAPPSSPASNGVTPASSKKDRDANAHAPEPTPLEKLLANSPPGPLRADGSDKFFGFENFGSTCYCNSIVQCLYYSAPFRDQVINFPTRSDAKTLADRPLRLNTDLNGIVRKPPVAAPPLPGQPLKPEDNKDAPEFKKKAALAAGPVLTMDYGNAAAYSMTESLFTALKDIFEAVIASPSRIGVVSPHKFLEILRRDNEMFRTPMHQDAHEFLNLLLNEVVENVETFSKNRIADSSSSSSSSNTTPPPATTTGWVHELFEGTLTSETRCLTCENTSQRDEAFLDLSVDLDQHSSVTSCLRKFSEEEMLCERNKFHCDNCGGLQEAEKRMKIKRLPKILALHLKRFKYTEDLQRLQKLFHRVVYPYYLRLFNTTDDAEDPDRLYELYAVVVHIGGGPYHGHYVSIIKTQDRGWLLFDDEMVEPVDKAFVRNFFGGDGVLACAYVLFYQETTQEAMMAEQEADGLAAAKQAEKLNLAVSTPRPPFTPTHDTDDMPSLNHALTAPIPPHDIPHTLEHATTQIPPAVAASAASAAATTTSSTPTYAPPTPILQGRKSSLHLFKKDKSSPAAQEKAQRHEAEKLAKAQRKEAEAARRESLRRQDDELKQALAASREAKDEEDRKRREDNGTPVPGGGMHEGGVGNGAGANGNGNGSSSGGATTGTASGGGATAGMKAGLSRFRQHSMSLKGKPKFWTKGHTSTSTIMTTPDDAPPTPTLASGLGAGAEDASASTPVGEDAEANASANGNGKKIGRKRSGFKF